MNVRICIVGVGLIGGSFARALKADGFEGEIIGTGRREANLRKAVELGVIDRYETEAAQAVKDADLIFLAVPLSAIQPVLEAIADHISPEAVITDAGSAKVDVIKTVEGVFKEVPRTFVPGHPIAGTEHSGVEASFAELFHDRNVVLTPLENTDSTALNLVRDLWQRAGARVVSMDPKQHDDILAATSHLPHVVAYALVNTVAGQRDDVLDFAAGGFSDVTRIASSDAAMWRDICLANRDALLKRIEDFESHLDQIKQAIALKNGETLDELFLRAKQARDSFIQ